MSDIHPSDFWNVVTELKKSREENARLLEVCNYFKNNLLTQLADARAVIELFAKYGQGGKARAFLAKYPKGD